MSSNPLIQVQGIATGGQVLTGEITPPSVGVNDYALRIVPGAEATPVGSTPVALTEIVTGTAIPRKYGAAADWVVATEGNRYGVRAQRNSGYSHKTLASSAGYKTVFAVVKHSGSTGNADMLNVGGIALVKIGAQWRFIGSGTLAGATFATPANQVQVLTYMVTASGVTVVDAAGGSYKATASPNASQLVELGTFGGYQDAAAGCMIFDAIAYDRALSAEEVLTVRQSLQAAWNAAPVGGITWN